MADTLLNFEHLIPLLNEYAERAKLIYKSEVTSGGHNASLDLINSLSAQVSTSDGIYEVSLNLNYYWKFLEGGSKGEISSPTGAVYKAHFPPVSALEKWIQVKPVIPRPDANGKIPSTKSLAFLIGRKIRDYGIEPFPALATTRQQLEEEFGPRFEEALGEDASLYLARVLRKA